MADTVQKRIVAALKERLEAVLVSGGFNTDAGLRVYKGRRAFDPDELPALSVWAAQAEPREEPRRHAQRFDVDLSVVIEGHAVANPADPADTAQDLIGDIKHALFVLEDRTLGGLAADLWWEGDVTELPEDGDVAVHVRVLASVRFPEIYGDPYQVL